MRPLSAVPLLALLSLTAFAQSAQSARDTILQARAQAMTQTRADIEAVIERFGGREEIEYEMEILGEEVQFLLEEQAQNGRRTFRSGSNDFGKAITISAIKPEWTYAWDASQGNFSAREVIVDFDRKLKKLGIDLIVIPVPSKIEAYAREFESEVPEGMPISLPRLEEMLYLLDQDVEVIDVLPTVLSLMTADDEVPLYETTGHHISGWGVKHTGELVANRLARYTFAQRDLARFSAERRNASERVSPNVPMLAWPVLDRGAPYAHVPRSPVVIMGDSNAFAYGTASWASHVARATGIPVTDISTSSGAPTAHTRLASQGIELLKQRRAVIWVISATHMERRPWSKTELRERPTFNGYLSAGLIEQAVAAFYAEDVDLQSLRIDESDLNDAAYELAREGKPERAKELFLINTRVFPYSANAFDSLGEAYVKLEENEKAVECLKKALTLNPSGNTRSNSMRLLAQLGVDYEPPKPVQLTQKAMKSLTGEYALSQNNKGLCRVEDGGLVFEFVGQPVMPMSPISDVVFTTEAGIHIEFTPATKETPTQVVLVGRGMRFEGEKKK